MVSETPSRQRTLLYLAALLFGATTTFYSIVWIYYAPRAGFTNLGVDFTYSVSRHYLKVSRVAEGSNAEQAGLRPGDKILAINDSKLDTLTPYYEWVWRGTPGSTVSFSVLRSGEDSPRAVPIPLESQRGIELYRALTPSRVVVLQIMRSYPIFFLVVGLAVLFLKVEDSTAWLLAFFFAGFIALPDFPSGVFPSALRGFAMIFHVTVGGLAAATLYCFLAVFPAPSPLERRAAWLKWALLVIAGLTIAANLWTIAVANAYETIWLPLEYGGPAWYRPIIRAPSYLSGMGAEILAVASLIGNSFWAATPEAQRKARVIVWGMACGLLPIILLITVDSLTGRRFQETPFWLYVFCVLSLFLLPLSFAYAVVKHRVLEIPVLLKRSARYLLVRQGFVLSTLIGAGAAFWLFVKVFSLFFPSPGNFSFAAGVGVGIIAVGAFVRGGSYIRRHVVQRIDREFFRDAYDTAQVMENLAYKSRAASRREELAELLRSEIKQAIHPASIALYLETSDGRLTLQPNGSQAELSSSLPMDAPVLRELAQRGQPLEVEPAGPGRNSAFGSLQPECLVPLLGGDGHLAGVIALGARLSEEPYSREDKHLLASVATQAGIALESIRRGEAIAEHLEAQRRAAQEMEFARQVQARLFPQKLPALATLDYAGQCVQARQVGGDYYDFLELCPGRVALVLADIAGKAVSGALLMANLQANLRSQYALALQDLPRLLKSVNQLFYENTDDHSYATLFFGDYDDSTRRLNYVNCGHLPPLLLHAAGGIERLTATATVLGLFEKWECETAQAVLAPGDTLVLYTDGVTEAANASEEEFGEWRLLETLQSNSHLPADTILQAIVAAVRQFSSAEQQDDITLVLARSLA